MKILLIDIETAPHKVYVWGLWNQNIAINKIIESGYTLCFSAKWYGSEEVIFESIFTNTPQKMIKKAHALLEEADAVVHYNGTSFDIPVLNKEFLLQGLKPPAPFKQIDLYNTTKKMFRFPSNKLDYVARVLKVGNKVEGLTHEVWAKCMEKDLDAWKTMMEYNINDVLILEKVYDKMKPWIKGHANFSLYQENSLCCPNCGSERYQRRGYAYTQAAKYARYQCTGCGHWFRQGVSMAPKPASKSMSI